MNNEQKKLIDAVDACAAYGMLRIIKSLSTADPSAFDRLQKQARDLLYRVAYPVEILSKAELDRCKMNAYELFTVPAGTAISEVETGDALVRRFKFVEPDATIKTLDIGPDGVKVMVADMDLSNVTFSAGTIDD